MNMDLQARRNAILVCLVAATSISNPASATQPESGWAGFGRILAERGPEANQRIYERRLLEKIEADTAIAEVRGMQADQRVRDRLVRLWQEVGLSSAEANAMAKAYQFDPAWEAMLMSVRRTGVSAAATDMWKAYDDRDFNRANVLLLSAAVVLAEQPPQQPLDPDVVKAVEDIQAQSKRWEENDPQFAEKMRILKPRMQSLVDQTPPDQWASQVEKAYLELDLDSPESSIPEHSTQE